MTDLDREILFSNETFIAIPLRVTASDKAGWHFYSDAEYYLLAPITPVQDQIVQGGKVRLRQIDEDEPPADGKFYAEAGQSLTLKCLILNNWTIQHHLEKGDLGIRILITDVTGKLTRVEGIFDRQTLRKGLYYEWRPRT